jgi:hypothetical protein
MSFFPLLDAELDAALSQLKSHLHRIEGKVDILMAKTDDVAAAIVANTATVKAMVVKITALDNGQANLQAEIDALKAASPAVDFTAVDAAMADQTAAIGQLSALVPA